MILERINSFEDKVFNFIDKYKKFFDKFINIYDLIFIKIIEVIQSVAFLIIDILALTGWVMRITTFPLHWIWIKYDIWKMHKHTSDITDYPIFDLGAHYIYGKPKSGKSTSTYHAMMDYAYHTGRTSYTTHPMEKPRKNIYGQEYFYHQVFDPHDYFNEGEQKFAFDTEHHNMIVFEEMLGMVHQRNNKKSDHNDLVIPMVASMGGQRHQGKGIDLFYFISQLPGNDISIMQMLRGYHVPKIKKGLDYKHWLKTGKYRFGILGWWFTSYDIQVTDRSSYKLVNKNKWFYPFKFEEDFKYFNEFNLKHKYDAMQVLGRKEMRA